MLRSAVDDLCWLESRLYPRPSSVKLVGDRYHLEQRQRVAVGRAASSNHAAEARRARCRRPQPGETVLIDGYNIITSLEAALSGALLIRCRDGAIRDMSSMGGSHRLVAETEEAIRLIIASLSTYRIGGCVFYLDRPVSNSAKLMGSIQSMAKSQQLCCKVELVRDPDPILARLPELIVTSDSAVLDGCRCWFNLVGELLSRGGGGPLPPVWLLDLS